MKPLGITLLILLLVCIIGVGYLYFNAGLTVTRVSVSATEALHAPELLEHVRKQMEQGSVTGTRFADSLSGGAEDYQLLSYQVSFLNRSFVPCDQVEIQITPQEGDVLQFYDAQSYTVPPRGEGSAEATLLTDVHSHTLRELVITYYIWGIPFTMRSTSDL